MNEWEWQVLEDKAPVDAVSAGAEMASAGVSLGSTEVGAVAAPSLAGALSTFVAALAAVSTGSASNLGDNTLASRSTMVFAAFESASRVGL